MIADKIEAAVRPPANGIGPGDIRAAHKRRYLAGFGVSLVKPFKVSAVR